MTNRLTAVACLLGVSLGVPSLAAQSAMSGIVREDGSGRPLPGVEVLVEGTGLRAATGENGRYLLAGLPSGPRIALFRLVGHLPVRVPILLVAGDTLRANATLIASEVVLAPVVVEGKVEDKVGVGVGREAFAERQRLGFGKFYDSAILRESEHLPLHDLIRRQGGVSVEPRVHDGSRKWIALNPFLRRGRDLDCAMQVYFNGSKLGEGGYLGVRGDPPDLRMFDLSALDAVEVYTSAAEVPQEYGGPTAGCGVLLLWSRQAP